ncbi:MAG: patatin-like phospholipase family protein [Cytophagales bacterium]|nr:patatin-like phospholipase family protein [Cytophaga sp.]
MDRKYRILSIDGGGVRGIIPATIIVYIENRLQRITKNPDVRISHYVDFIAGTSTGGILASAYLCPSDTDASIPKFTAEDALRFYLERGGYIFSSGMWDKLISLGGIIKERYAALPLEKFLAVSFRNVKVSELMKPCLLTSYEIEKKKPVFFQSHVAKNEEAYDFFVRDACRATSSAPTFFEPARIQSISGETYTLIDGAVLANNPTLCALSEAAVLFAENGIPLTADRFEVISLGTGKNQKTYTYDQVKDWGGLGWLNPLLDVMMNGVSDTTERELSVLFQSLQASGQYHRIQPELLHANAEMDDASSGNIQLLMEAAAACIEKHKDDLEVIIQRLIQYDKAL